MRWFSPQHFVPSWILSRRVSSFQKFFEMGQEESVSPFLNVTAKNISKNLPLKTALLALLFLIVAAVTNLFTTSPFWLLEICIVYLLVGTPALIAAAEDVQQKDINIDVLMTLAAFGALTIGGILEGALLLVLFALSGALSDLVTLKAKSTLCAIHELAPEIAYVVEPNGQFSQRAVSDIDIGTVIAVRAGEIIPLDGQIVRGKSSISTAHLTGESAPLYVQEKDSVISGTKVLDGGLEIRVESTQYDSTVSKLIRLITRAHSSKPALTKTFDAFGKLYASAVIAITTLFCFLLPFFCDISFWGEQGSFFRAMTFLITASPCALILAVPITYLSALGAAARSGAILKGSSVFDSLVYCDSIAFDKTGTLTEGTLHLESIAPVTEKNRAEALSFAAALERHAVHPTASAILDAFAKLQQPFPEVTHIQVRAGVGVEGSFVDIPLFIGRPEEALRRLNLDTQKIQSAIDTAKQEGATVAMLCYGSDEAYLLRFADALRKEAISTVSDLQALHKHVVMLTGDNRKVAEKIGTSLGIGEVHAELSPEVKLSIIDQLSKMHGTVMVGDGINDAPALAKATVGVSMGKLSSASAREASDVVLLHNDLSVLVWLFKRAMLTRRIVIQNVGIATGAIVLGTIAASFALLPLWVAVCIHEGSTLVVGLNALRLLRR